MAYSATTVQKSVRGAYQTSQGCACGECSIFSTPTLDCNKDSQGIFDWHLTNEDCCGGFCPQRKTCVPVDKQTCSIGQNEKGEDPLEDAKWDKRSPNVKCTYDESKMQDIKIVSAYKDKYGQDENWKNMMIKVCSQQSTDCGVDPLTGAPFKSCSNMNATTEAGDQCRLFYNQETQQVRDSIVQDYCLRHPTNVDCSCVARLADPKYRELKRYAPFNDGCWYAPCTTQSYLTTEEVKDPTCPSNVCQIIFDLLNNNNVNINDNQNSINCKFPDKIEPPPVRPPPPPKPDNRPSSAVFIGGALILGILVLGLIAVAASRRT